MTRRIYYKDKSISLYIDANVLRNYCTGQKADVECLNFLFEKRKRDKLFTSTFAIGQVLSAYQNRKGITKEKTLEKGNFFLNKMSLIDFLEKDVKVSLELSGNDVEDNMHYILSKKKKCAIIITNDKNGFAEFKDVIVIKPTKLGFLQNMIN